MSTRDKFLWAFVVVWLGLIGSFWLAGLTYWAWAFGLIITTVAVIEGIVVLRTRLTISKQFGAWARKHKLLAGLLLGGMLVAWILLLIHLAI
jgi:hypothetical protein